MQGAFSVVYQPHLRKEDDEHDAAQQALEDIRIMGGGATDKDELDIMDTLELAAEGVHVTDQSFHSEHEQNARRVASRLRRDAQSARRRRIVFNDNKGIPYASTAEQYRRGMAVASIDTKKQRRAKQREAAKAIHHQRNLKIKRGVGVFETVELISDESDFFFAGDVVTLEDPKETSAYRVAEGLYEMPGGDQKKPTAMQADIAAETVRL